MSETDNDVQEALIEIKNAADDVVLFKLAGDFPAVPASTFSTLRPGKPCSWWQLNSGKMTGTVERVRVAPVEGLPGVVRVTVWVRRD